MNIEDIKRILKKGESHNVEFKERFGDDVIETLVAFSNSNGGRVLVGVNSMKKMVGVASNEESIQNWLNEIKTKTADRKSVV